MLTLETIRKVMKMQATYGSYDGACFGTPCADRLRPPTTPPKAHFEDKESEKPPIDPEKLHEAMEKGREERIIFAREQEKAHRLTPNETDVRYK
jgi:hypothetical protein